jgi:hypothetical protein
MNLYDAVMKGPPKWLIRATVMLGILTIGAQIGMYRERTKQTAQAIGVELGKKDALIDGYRAELNNARFDLDVEKQKLSIILCESGCKHTGVWGDGGKSYGIAQFKYKTFCELRTEAGLPALRWKNRDDQVRLLDWALRHGYGKYWTCYTGGKS